MAPVPKSDTLPRFDGWETIEKLGEGGMCEVYRVRPASGNGPERAVKVLMDRSDTSIRRFTDEGVLIQRIVHPNIVRVHHIADSARPPWLVMDLLAGRDLEETIEVEGAMDPERAAPMFADLANALAAVHAAGVRHRDIKPANLRLGTDGVPRLIDFGIARDATAERHTKQGFVVGTASYLPPEIFTEDDSHRVQDTEVADVYALGQTLSEVLAGRVTHGHREDGTEASLLVRIMRDKMEREYLDPRDKGAHVPEELAAIVRRATARDPAERTPSARTFERELRGWIQGRTSFGSTAPVSRVELRPGREPVTGVGGPSLPPSGPPSIVPVPRRGELVVQPPPRRARFAVFGALGAMGMAGAAVLVVGLVVLAVAGVVSLWVFRPQASPAEAGVLEAVAALNSDLASCRTAPGEMAVVLTVRAGHAQEVEVARSTVDRRTEKCVARVLTKARYPDGAAVTVEVPVVFR